MSAPDRIKELNDQAFYSLLKALIWTDAEKNAAQKAILELQELLGVDNDTYKRYLVELSKSKPKRGAAPPAQQHYSAASAYAPAANAYAAGPAGYSHPPSAYAAPPAAGYNAGAAVAVPAQRNFKGGGSILSSQSGPWPQPGGPHGAQGMTEAPKRRKDGMPPWMGYVISRFFQKEGGWFNGVVTDYRPALNQYSITYELGNNSKETAEWLDLDKADSQYTFITSEKVNLLTQYPNSKAVQTSEFLRQFQSGRAGKEGGKANNKKRRSDDGDEY